MIFSSPLWLALLVPYLGVAIYLFRGARHRAAVPFLQLWEGPVHPAPEAPQTRLPPVPIILALLALLLAILGCAQPGVITNAQAPVTIVIDHGLTMSALSGGRPRYAALQDEVLRELKNHPVQIVNVPPTTQPTAMDTTDALLSQCRLATAPTIVLTDQELDSRALRISPNNPVNDVAIIGLEIRESPRAQVMVRIRNDSNIRTIELMVSSAGKVIARHIDLPPPSQQRDYFVSLNDLGDSVRATIKINDDQPFNNIAWSARQISWPRIELDLHDENLNKFIAVYRKLRPPTASSKSVRITSSIINDRCIVLAAGNQPVQQNTSPVVRDHPVTRGIDWKKIAESAVLASASPPADFSPLVTIGGKILLAESPGHIRQIWVGFDSDSFAQTPDYVIFWTNLVTYVGGGGEAFAFEFPHLLDSQWQHVDGPASAIPGYVPGLFRNSAGQFLAINAPPLRAHSDNTDWRHQLNGILTHSRDAISLAPWMLCAAIAMLAAGVVLARR